MSKTLIQTVTVGAGGAASIDFTNIPQTYTDLMVVFSLRGTVSAGVSNVKLAFNGSTSSYSGRTLMGFGSGAGYSEINVDQYSTPWPFINFYAHVGSTSTANVFSNGSISVPNYTASSNKRASIDWVNENNAAGAWSGINTGLWSNSAAITSLSLGAYTGTWVSGSSASLYGVNKIAPSGSGATPTVEYLVVAGGGGAAPGGGGAGGLVTGSGYSVSSGSPITVTVGAGGTGGAWPSSGTSGSNSVFASATTAVGGGYGGGPNVSGGNGGSGGGGGSTSGGGVPGSSTGTAGQGYAGGIGTSASNQAGGGGGGGAAGAGGSYPSGTGGNGLPSSITGASLYYAGGGGSANTASAGGLGGGGTGSSGTGGSGAHGLSGTGGGGGGSIFGVAGNGGSGAVVIRYPDIYANPTATTGNPVVNYANGYKIYTWTNSGSVTF
jgi:hypothetical protein